MWLVGIGGWVDMYILVCLWPMGYFIMFVSSLVIEVPTLFFNSSNNN